jgi:hypothetical protein
MKTNKKIHYINWKKSKNKNAAKLNLKFHKRTYFPFSLCTWNSASGHGLLQAASYPVIRKIKEPQNNLLGCSAQILITELLNIQHECQQTATFHLTVTNPKQAALRPYPGLRSRQTTSNI